MASIQKMKEQLAGIKATNVRRRLKAKGEALTHTVVAGAAAFAMGRVEKGATGPLPSVLGLDHKLLYGVVAHAVSTGSSGKFAELASAAGDGLISCYGYAEGKGTAMRGVAGHDAEDFEAV